MSSMAIKKLNKEKQLMNKIIIWLLVFSMATKDSNAVLPGAVFVGTLAATIASLKMGHYYQKKSVLKRQVEHLELINSFKQEDWQKFRPYPHAAKMVKELFKRRDLSPKDFGFRWAKKNEGWSFAAHSQLFCFKESTLSKVNNFLCNQDPFRENVITIEGEQGDILSFTGKEYCGLVRFIIGHEIQHACDSQALKEIYNSLNHIKVLIEVELKLLKNEKGYFGQNTLAEFCENLDQLRILESIEEEKKIKEIQPYEKKADINASLNPDELRIGAKWFTWGYEQDIKLDALKWEYFYKHEDEHPHPLERARYLRELADEFEEREQEKQSQFAQKYLVLPN